MAVFLICEFDPFHYGHEYIIKKAKELYPGAPVVCVMSGSFVQRGRPAVADAFSRGRCAVEGGADLVLSLPFPWCASSAERFAEGALSVIAGLYRPGDALVFGSECGDAVILRAAAETLSSPDFRRRLDEYVKETKTPYAKARELLYDDGEVLSAPNDILGIEYIKAAAKLCPGLEITPVKRDPAFASSTDIKNAADPLSLVPGYAKRILSETDFPADIKYAERLIISHLRASPYRQAADGEHGLIFRLSEAAKNAGGFDELVAAASSAQFTNARIRRAALYSYFGVNAPYLKDLPCFTQLIAADGAGIKYLSSVRATRRTEIITKPSDLSKLSEKAKKQYELQRRSDEFYCFCNKNVLPGAYFLRCTPYIK
ncbi:MAG: nucleotidyltransferase family protein [Clostridia bacterium]|nr:nucleotidyltransferase family protein [Clostridia bacterium]